MSQKKTPIQDKSAAKKAAVLGKDNDRRPLVLLVMAACAALVLGGAALFLGGAGQEPSALSPARVAEAQAGEVAYPAADFEDGKCRFYEYKTPEGLAIRYFVVKSSDGVIRAAFDACDSCWHAGKGYQQEGDELVCRNCRQRFASVKVNEVKGGCNPAPLARRLDGGKVVIRVEDILAGRTYFDFKKEG